MIVAALLGVWFAEIAAVWVELIRQALHRRRYARCLASIAQLELELGIEKPLPHANPLTSAIAPPSAEWLSVPSGYGNELGRPPIPLTPSQEAELRRRGIIPPAAGAELDRRRRGAYGDVDEQLAAHRREAERLTAYVQGQSEHERGIFRRRR